MTIQIADRGMRIQLFAIVMAGGLMAFTQNSSAQNSPFDEPQDSAMAVLRPDEYAWRLFVALNWPADVDNKLPHPMAKLGAHGPVVWETWKNANEVFLQDGSDPGEWLGKPAQVANSVDDFDRAPLQQLARDRVLRIVRHVFDPIAALSEINETRLNRTTYEFIRAKELYNLGGQNKLAQSGIPQISFPEQAKEVKAQWRQIGEQDKPRYHWAELKLPDDTKRLYGLTALHITTKDLPNWFWATFEHVDNPTRGPTRGDESWKLPSVDRFACPLPPHDCNQAPRDIGLEGTIWTNYRLRGTQIDFIDSRGNPLRLANSQPEERFQETSSCITCHARATIGSSGNDRLQIFASNGDGHIGVPDPSWYVKLNPSGEPIQLYTQLDFVWSLFRANPKKN